MRNQHTTGPTIRYINYFIHLGSHISSTWNQIISTTSIDLALCLSEQNNEEPPHGHRIKQSGPLSKKIVSEKMKRAPEIEHGMRMRNDVILKISKCIFSHQREFLETGDRKLIKPLTLEDLSRMSGLSVSMISRAIRGKVVRTPVGTFELREFLSRGISDTERTGGEKVAQRVILEEIKNIISSESRQKPLSDSEIADIIKDKFSIRRNFIEIPLAESTK